MFEGGALVLLPFPYSDASTLKRRPVLALTKPDQYGDFIGMAVTSRDHHADSILIEQSALIDGSLPKASWIRIDRVVTLNVSLVTKIFAITGVFARTGIEIHQRAVNGLCDTLRQYISSSRQV